MTNKYMLEPLPVSSSLNGISSPCRNKVEGETVFLKVLSALKHKKLLGNESTRLIDVKRTFFFFFLILIKLKKLLTVNTTIK